MIATHWPGFRHPCARTGGSPPVPRADRRGPLHAAMVRRGIAGASAPWIRSTTRWQVWVREFTAAGAEQFSIVPAGAETWIGRNRPAFAGISGPTRVFTA